MTTIPDFLDLCKNLCADIDYLSGCIRDGDHDPVSLAECESDAFDASQAIARYDREAKADAALEALLPQPYDPTPPPEPPTDQELVTFLYVIDPGDELSPLAMVRAALERWGHG
jgi:hypothetical protein